MSIKTVLSDTKKLVQARSKIALYQENEKDPPTELLDDIYLLERHIKVSIRELPQDQWGLLKNSLEVKGADESLLEDEVLSELEYQFEEANSSIDVDVRNGEVIEESRIMFMPFLYQNPDPKEGQFFDLDKNTKESFEEFIHQFVEKRVGAYANNSVLEDVMKFEVIAANGNLMGFQFNPKSSYFLKNVNWAILNDESIETIRGYLHHSLITNVDEEADGLSVGVVPICIKGNPLLLNLLQWGDWANEFEEEFHETFDPTHDKYYIAPLSYFEVNHQLMIELWKEHLIETVSRMQETEGKIELRVYIGVNEQDIPEQVVVNICKFDLSDGELKKLIQIKREFFPAFEDARQLCSGMLYAEQFFNMSTSLKFATVRKEDIPYND